MVLGHQTLYVHGANYNIAETKVVKTLVVSYISQNKNGEPEQHSKSCNFPSGATSNALVNAAFSLLMCAPQLVIHLHPYG